MEHAGIGKRRRLGRPGWREKERIFVKKKTSVMSAIVE